MSSDNAYVGVYLSKFQDILDMETIAEGIYGYYIEHLQDHTLLEKFKEIYEDKKAHVKIAQRLIEMIAGQYEP